MADPPRIRRRLFVTAAALGACAVSAPFVHAQPRPEKPRLVVSAPARAELPYLPLTVADQLGFFRAEGLDVELVDAPGAPADLVSGTFDHTISLQARGQPVQSIVLQGRAPAVALGVSTRALASVRSVADLRGRRIGVTAAGSPSHLVASQALARAGLGPSDVEWVGLGGGPATPAALRQLQVDALCGPEPAMTVLEHRAEVRIVVDARSLKGTQDVLGGPMPSACLYAPQEFVQRHPASCQALANALVHALKWLQTAGPRDLLRTVPEAYLLGDRALYLAAFERLRESISPDGLLPEAGARTALRLLSQFDPAVGPGRVEVARTYTNEFALRAKERFRA